MDTQQEAQVHSIYPMNETHCFHEDEAYELVNLLYVVTQKTKNTVHALNSQLEFHKAMPHQADNIQRELNLEISKWSDKVKRLGATPLALFKVKIHAHEGYYIWEFPSAEIEHHY